MTIAENGYTASLSNGQRWFFIYTEKMLPWMKQMAEIMKLEETTTLMNIDSNSSVLFIMEKDNEGKITRVIREKFQPFLGIQQKTNSYSRHDFNIFYLSTLENGKDNINILYDSKSEEMSKANQEDKHRFDIVRMRCATFPIFIKSQHKDGLPFHATLIVRDKEGILLAAPPKTGKSTSCRRISYPWHCLCDDTALITCNEEGKYQVHPFPTWSDYLYHRASPTWNVQESFNLKAIFFLEQAKIDKVVPIGQGQAVIRIHRSSKEINHLSGLVNNEKRKQLERKLFDNACTLAKKIPAFILNISLEGQFWNEIEKVL